MIKIDRKPRGKGTYPLGVRAGFALSPALAAAAHSFAPRFGYCSLTPPGLRLLDATSVSVAVGSYSDCLTVTHFPPIHLQYDACNTPHSGAQSRLRSDDDTRVGHDAVIPSPITIVTYTSYST